MKELPKRKDIRLKKYDYSQSGAYFITICTKNRENLFWTKNDDNASQLPVVGATCGRPLKNIRYSNCACFVENEIRKIPEIYNGTVIVDKYVIMPDHLHMIIFLKNIGRPQVAPTISRVIKQFKGTLSKKAGFSVWQKSFIDRVIRDDNEYQKIWKYIDENPYKLYDKLNGNL